MTSGDEHNVDELEQNLHDKGAFDLLKDLHSTQMDSDMALHLTQDRGLGVTKITDGSNRIRNVRETVLFPRDRSRVTP